MGLAPNPKRKFPKNRRRTATMPPKIDNAASGSGDNTGEVTGRVSFKVPPFWRSNPGLWFAQIEAQFVTSHITTDAARYNTVVASIESAVLAQVSDIILGPVEGQSYESLKKRLVSVFADTEQQRMRKLLSEITLDDKKPSQLLREMRELAGTAVPDDLLQTLWVQRLSPTTSAILSANSGNLAELANLADKIAEVTQSTKIEAVSATPEQPYQRLEKQIEALARQISSLQGGRGRSRTPARNRSQSRGRSSSKVGNEYCYFHRRFGDAARNCRPPCANKKTENTQASH